MQGNGSRDLFVLQLNEISGERVTEVIRRAYSMPPEIIKAANEAMNLTGTTQ